MFEYWFTREVFAYNVIKQQSHKVYVLITGENMDLLSFSSACKLRQRDCCQCYMANKSKPFQIT